MQKRQTCINSSLRHQKCKRKGFTSIRKVFSLRKERENEKKSISTQKKSNSTSEEKYFYIEKKSIYIKKTVRKEKEKKSISTHPFELYYLAYHQLQTKIS